LAPRKQLATK
nr:Chain A, 10-mer peptide from histone H3 [synthetic construct]